MPTLPVWCKTGGFGHHEHRTRNHKGANKGLATARNRSQPLATARNRSQPLATARNRSQSAKPLAPALAYLARLFPTSRIPIRAPTPRPTEAPQRLALLAAPQGGYQRGVFSLFCEAAAMRRGEGTGRPGGGGVSSDDLLPVLEWYFTTFLINLSQKTMKYHEIPWFARNQYR